MSFMAQMDLSIIEPTTGEPPDANKEPEITETWKCAQTQAMVVTLTGYGKRAKRKQSMGKTQKANVH